MRVRKGWYSGEYLASNGEGTEDNPFFPINDVNIQDQTTPPFDLHVFQPVGAPTTTTAVTTIDGYNVSVASTAGLSPGDDIALFSGDLNDQRYYFGRIVGILGLVLTMDSPLDFAMPIGSTLLHITTEMAVDGSTVPQVFAIQAGDSGLEIDITRLMVYVECATTVVMNLFGDLPALTNGLVIRRRDGTYRNIVNWKRNVDMAQHAFDFQVFDKTHPVNDTDALMIRYTFAGQDKHGVAIRIGPDEALEVIVQDDLTGLNSMSVLVEGHIVDDPPS